MLNEIVHILYDVPAGRKDGGRLETERTLNGRTVVVCSVKVIYGLFVIRTSIAARSTLVG